MNVNKYIIFSVNTEDVESVRDSIKVFYYTLQRQTDEKFNLMDENIPLGDTRHV